MTLGEKLRNARTNKNMKQKDLADATGLALRTIQNYESDERIPRQRETYTKLANALGISEDVLLDDNASFILEATERYGEKGRREAVDLAANFRSMYAGGELDEEDVDAVMRAVQMAYWEIKDDIRIKKGQLSTASPAEEDDK